jgi:hypothetical protein
LIDPPVTADALAEAPALSLAAGRLGRGGADALGVPRATSSDDHAERPTRQADHGRSLDELTSREPSLGEGFDEVQLDGRRLSTHEIKPGIVHGAILLDHVTDP